MAASVGANGGKLISARGGSGSQHAAAAMAAARKPLAKLRHVAFSGGGMLGLAYTGAVAALSEAGALKDVRHVAGISIGAMFAALVAADVDMAAFDLELRAFCGDPDNLTIRTTDALALPSRLGVYDARRLLPPLRKCLAARHGRADLTLGDVRRATGCAASIVATNLHTGQPAILSSDATPDVPLLDAVLASMALPFVMPPQRLGETWYADGGLTCDSAERALVAAGADPDETLHLFLRRSEPAPALASPTLSLTHFVNAVVAALSFGRDAARFAGHALWLDNCPIPFLPLRLRRHGIVFDLPPAHLDAAKAYGAEAVRAFIAAQQQQKNDDSA